MNGIRRRYELYMATLNQEEATRPALTFEPLSFLALYSPRTRPISFTVQIFMPSTLRSSLSNSTPSSSSSRVWAAKESSHLPSIQATGEADSIPLHLGATNSFSLRSGMRTRSGPSMANPGTIRKNSGDVYSVNRLTSKHLSATITSISLRAKAKRCCVRLRHA